MKKSIVILFLLFAVKFSFGQQKLIPAKVILCKNTNDTLKGEIKVNTKKIHEIYKRITFKPTTGPQKLFKPGIACIFFMEGKKFISMDFEGQPSEFLKVLAEGKINFYKGYAEFANMNEITFEPVYYFTDKNGNLEEADEKKFAKQIKQRVGKDLPELKELEALKQFDEKAIAQWIQNYNSKANVN